MASNLGVAKSIAPCEATEPGKYVTQGCLPLRIFHNLYGNWPQIMVVSLILASNLGAAKSIALCEATEPGQYVTCKYIF